MHGKVCVCTCKYSNATVREREDGCVSRQERGMFGIGHLILVIGFGASQAGPSASDYGPNSYKAGAAYVSLKLPMDLSSRRK